MSKGLNFLGLAMAGLLILVPPRLTGATVSVTRGNYHGWPDALLITNQTTAVVVVPQIGRVMQFGFTGEVGVFWENPALEGQTNTATLEAWRQGEWVNFGGDKAWPAPEAEWAKHTQRGWRPPPAFDYLPYTAEVLPAGVVLLTSPVDPIYGIRVSRRVQLDPNQAVLRITTTFARVSGPETDVSVWVVTQLRDPTSLFVPVRPGDGSAAYVRLTKDAPPSLQVTSGLLSLRRDRQKSYKIGTQAGSLLWVGRRTMLRIDSPRSQGESYPDQGSSAEIYTNPDPLPYIELETLGPLRRLRAGEKIEQTNTYTLLRRSSTDPVQDARKALGL